MKPFLKKAKKLLEAKGFEVQPTNEDVIEVYMPETEAPFLFVMHDKKEFDGLALSFCTDFPFPSIVASTTIELMHITLLVVGTSFMVAEDGNVIFGTDADFYENRTALSDLANMPSPSSYTH